ncbi:hypothetical protein ES703_02525 [subsurface metagenome]|nr:hypothetical protein [bacterium]
MHKLKLCSYNIKWMAHLFKKKGVEPLTGSSEEAERSKAIAYVIKAVDPDILGICEAPNSPQHLENWVREFLSDAGYNVVMSEEGFLSRGQQELAVLYKSEKVHVGVAHERNAKRDPFTEDYVNVLIDHVLFSQGIKISEPGCGRVWNPYQNEKEIGDKKLREALDNASDHYPVSVEVEIE